MKPADLEQVVNEARARALDDANRANDELLSVLFHELRITLTPILAWAQLLKRASDPARVDQAADVIERNVRIQMAIVADVLDISRITQKRLQLDLQRHNVRDIVQAAVARAQESAAEKRVHIATLFTAPRPITADIDRPRTEQIVTYLLTNAIRFTPTDGTVTMTLRRETEMAVITVLDAGVPIEDDHLAFVFEPFHAEELTGRNNGTAGIQLALARRLAELHGGTLDVASPGTGAEFTLRLPLRGRGRR